MLVSASVHQHIKYINTSINIFVSMAASCHKALCVGESYPAQSTLHCKAVYSLKRLSGIKTLLSEIGAKGMPRGLRSAWRGQVSVLPMSDFSLLHQTKRISSRQPGKHQFVIILANGNCCSIYTRLFKSCPDDKFGRTLVTTN